MTDPRETIPEPRPIQVDDLGRLFEVTGEQFIMPGLEPAKILEALADEKQSIPLAAVGLDRFPIAR